MKEGAESHHPHRLCRRKLMFSVVITTRVSLTVTMTTNKKEAAIWFCTYAVDPMEYDIGDDSVDVAKGDAGGCRHSAQNE